MAVDSKTQIYYIDLGGGLANIGAFKYAWRAKTGSYDDIGKDMGVNTAKDTEKGLIFGANSPKPARVRINYVYSGGTTRSVIRFCEPDKLNALTTGGAINGKKIKVNGVAYNVSSCDIA